MNRNYFAHGGKELVIGGKLTFLPGATVEGADGLFDVLPTMELDYDPPYLPHSTAATIAALREDYNRLLDVLIKAGILLATPEEAVPDDPDR